LLLVGRNRRQKLSSFVASSVEAMMMITDEQMEWACPLIPPRQTHIGSSWNYSTDDDVWAVVCGPHSDLRLNELVHLSTDVPTINIKTFFFSSSSSSYVCAMTIYILGTVIGIEKDSLSSSVQFQRVVTPPTLGS
jgi:hypothetical protein